MVITVFVGGIVLIAVLAVVVGVLDALQASTWRGVARERRSEWEARQLVGPSGG